MDLNVMYDLLNSVTAIPIVPYKKGKIDMAGHRKNIRYLMDNNYLDNDRKRVISIAGTSLIHHFTTDEQMDLISVAGEEINGEGVVMSGIVPNPIATAEELVRRQSALPFPPDLYLLMPLTGVADPDGIYQTYLQFGNTLGQECGAHFLLYLRSVDHIDVVVRLITESPFFIGVKVGTSEDHVEPLIDQVGDNGIVMWGIGDRSTGAARAGALGHTSGIAVVAARASDEINNAQRKGDLAASQKVEDIIAPLEDLRFMNGRQYNYSAVVEALKIGGWDDIEAGEGGPFNPRVPASVAQQVAEAVDLLKDYH